jgi:hypothetical protein
MGGGKTGHETDSSLALLLLAATSAKGLLNQRVICADRFDQVRLSHTVRAE